MSSGKLEVVAEAKSVRSFMVNREMCNVVVKCLVDTDAPDPDRLEQPCSSQTGLCKEFRMC
jgi:hypothetical protein